MVSILDSLHRFSFQFIKNGNAGSVNGSRSVQEWRVVMMYIEIA